ncbi:MAG: glycosyltransferase family 2 protein [Sedimentisphaerales bacterium]|jgi:glycosyltransferase involved in cell wall biosynthesis
MVSIIIPTYNRSQLVKESIDSLLAQTYNDLEILVVDDGSTDDTQQTVTGIAQKDNRVKYYLRPHLGTCAARNFGLEQSKGEFVGFFDHDDLWPANYIEIMVKSLQAMPDFGVAYSKIMKFGDECGEYGASGNWVSGFVTSYFFTAKLAILPSSAIFRRSALGEIRFEPSLRICEAFDVFLRISMRTKFLFVPNLYAMHRERDDTAGPATGKDLVVTNGARVMERFYFQLGGNSYVPKRPVFRKISHNYRRAALYYYRAGYRAAAIILLKKALSYDPLDLRLYLNLFKAFIMNPKKDKMPDWQLPPALPPIPK